MKGKDKRLPSPALALVPAVTHLSDEEAMLSVRAGEVEHLEILFDRYQRPLFNFFCKLGGSREISEDLVQDVFYRILKYRETFKPGTSFRTWMYQIARNARIDKFRKQRPEVEVEHAEDIAATGGPDPVLAMQESAMLQKAMQQLAPEKRELLVLSRFQELSYDEMGQLLGCESGTAKVRVFRALQELRQIYMRLHQGTGASRTAPPGQGVQP